MPKSGHGEEPGYEANFIDNISSTVQLAKYYFLR